MDGNVTCISWSYDFVILNMFDEFASYLKQWFNVRLSNSTRKYYKVASVTYISWSSVLALYRECEFRGMQWHHAQNNS